MQTIISSATLLFMLLNPFLLVVYLVDVMSKQSVKNFSKVLLRASLISITVFSLFGILGDYVFNKIIQADFASFQIFGGIVFLIIGIRFVFGGQEAIEMLRGESERLAGVIAMPIFIGPGTISASILIGKKMPVSTTILTISCSVLLSVGIMILLKMLYDYLVPRKKHMIDGYIEVSGRITALYVGTISLDMIMRGLEQWINKLSL